MEILEKVQLSTYTSWQIGGPAEHFCLPKNLDELKSALVTAEKNSWKVTVLGGGSNVLVSDEGIAGLVICLKDFVGSTVEVKEGFVHINVWAGTSKSELLKIFLKHRLVPALFLAGLPGDTGGGVVMNAGVAEQISPREFGEIVDWVEVLRPKTLTVDRLHHDQITWSYRHSQGWQPGIVVQVGIKWPNEPQLGILDQVKKANLVRLSKQPLDMPSCGSVFVNPVGHKAAQLIEQCGLKGYKVGGAQVSTKHANFIVNLGSATAKDVKKVIEHVQRTVYDKKNILLKTEVISL